MGCRGSHGTVVDQENRKRKWASEWPEVTEGCGHSAVVTTPSRAEGQGGWEVKILCRDERQGDWNIYGNAPRAFCSWSAQGSRICQPCPLRCFQGADQTWATLVTSLPDRTFLPTLKAPRGVSPVAWSHTRWLSKRQLCDVGCFLVPHFSHLYKRNKKCLLPRTIVKRYDICVCKYIQRFRATHSIQNTLFPFFLYVTWNFTITLILCLLNNWSINLENVSLSKDIWKSQFHRRL